MDWLYVSLNVCFQGCFVFTLWAFKLLAFMDWFDVSMKVSLLCCLIFTLCALKPLAFMDWIYVPLKIMFLQSFIITVWTFILFVHHVKNCWCYWIKSEFNNNVDKNLSVPKIKQTTDWSWNKLALIWGEAQLCLPGNKSNGHHQHGPIHGHYQKNLDELHWHCPPHGHSSQAQVGKTLGTPGPGHFCTEHTQSRVYSHIFRNNTL